ncbi:PTS IIA-like nitrogen regulatory protein PtsN [Alphaproteobacteria bacterium]|nr:PTS IIA-like nitrogen regulatory protein PtsN [Alphaproteobacteria bacterium]|tara:strand:- start:171 stop:626 length:456 start_codon:yes stop_codon:yes gene_type:complete
METNDLLSTDSVITDLKGSGKKQILQELSNRASQITKIESRAIFTTLLEREKLGTTGIGQGVAIPHGKISKLKKSFGIFARLSEPVNFDAVDDEPVDLIFLLLAPDQASAEHLKTLARVSRLLRDQKLCQKLRGSVGNDAIYSVFTESFSS